MNICHIHPYNPPAKDSMGAERVIERTIHGLKELGHGAEFHNPEEGSKDFTNRFPEWADILHFHSWRPGEIDYDKYGKPWVVTLHGGGMETDPKWLKDTANNPHVICVSKFVSDRVKCPAYVWTCAETHEFMFRKEKKDYFLFMAGLDWGEGKGLFTTIRLAKMLRIKLKIAGAGKNQEVINYIKSLCDDKIEYIGPVNGKEKAEVLAGAKALILLTQLPDACPTTVSEAMMSGTPVIGSFNGSMPELIRHGVNGYLCRTDADFAKAVATISKIDPMKCFEIGVNQFSHIATAKKYLFYYENLLRDGRVDSRDWKEESLQLL